MGGKRKEKQTKRKKAKGSGRRSCLKRQMGERESKVVKLGRKGKI